MNTSTPMISVIIKSNTRAHVLREKLQQLQLLGLLDSTNLAINHAKLLQANAPSGNNNSKSILERTTGRFYTHELIGRHLSNAVLKAVDLESLSTVKVVEPFCGDGRLICWLLEASRKFSKPERRKWLIEIWDCDATALGIALKQIHSTAIALGLNVEIHASASDVFHSASDHFGKFDICITNPPWELLKPDRREMSDLSKEQVRTHISYLRTQASILSKLYPNSVPSKKFSGWGVNLARCGIELSLKLITSKGVCGVVSPASFLADQTSGQLRKWVFTNHTFNDIAYYAAEAKLFEKVDQPSITLVAVAGKSKDSLPAITIYDRNLKPLAVTTTEEDWNKLAGNGYIFPIQFGLNLIGLLAKWEHLPTFQALEGVRNGLRAGRELDETGYQKFIKSKGHYKFIKGRMVERYAVSTNQSSYINPDIVRIPPSVNFYRIAWRDVSRPNQKRRMHAAIIPPGCVTGNSLGIAYYIDKDLDHLKALLAVMNSFVFEAQVRMHLGTAHVSLGAVRKARVPNLTSETIQKLSTLADKCQSNEPNAFVDTEVFVAKLYKLSREDFAKLLSSFDKVDAGERQELLSSQRWNS